jgi:phosphoribosylanthranilate isomerase
MIRVKICGVTNASDAKAACEAGANLVGLNFYRKSPRYISDGDAAKVRAALPAEVEAVGVFVNSAPAEVLKLSRSLKLDAAQLHGDESPEVVSEVARAVTVFKAFRVGKGFSLESFGQYAEAYAFLLDAARAGQYGGTGFTTDWAVARRAALSRRILLAGGLKLENVAAAIRLVRPYGVDVASGVEAKPGKKDHGRMREFIQEVRGVEKQLHLQAESSPTA